MPSQMELSRTWACARVSYVTPATEVMSVAELDQVWVLAEVFERQAAWVKPGQQATSSSTICRASIWQGTVDYVYPELDPKRAR